MRLDILASCRCQHLRIDLMKATRDRHNHAYKHTSAFYQMKFVQTKLCFKQEEDW